MNHYFYLIVSQAKHMVGSRSPGGRFISLASLATVMIFAVGCGDSGPPRAAVQGSASWKGTPVEDGMINFIPQDGGPATTAKIVAGTYSLPKEQGALIATHTVQIFGIKHLGLIEAGAPHPPGTKIEATEQFIPGNFNNASKLTVEIKEGDNQHDFALPM